MKENKGSLHVCNTTEEYQNYQNLVDKLIDNASKITFWQIIQCQPRCKYTEYEIHKISESNFDVLDYIKGTSEGANTEIMLFFTSTEIGKVRHQFDITKKSFAR